MTKVSESPKDTVDEVREASLADEGGASAAMVESQDPAELRRLAEGLPVGHLTLCHDDEKGLARLPTWVLLTLAALSGLLSLALLRRS